MLVTKFPEAGKSNGLSPSPFSHYHCGMADWDVAIIGGGPAGLMAGSRAAERGRRTILFDKNRQPGAKILLSGGTRCNLTHAADALGIIKALGPAGRFLHSALAALGPEQVVEIFAAEGVPTKTEPGGKVFPASDRASDVLAALMRRARHAGCTLATAEPVTDVLRAGAGFQVVTPKRRIEVQSVLLATGGRSYPASGTTGDGYRWAAALGHRIVTPRPALVPITSHAPWVLALQGITLPDVLVRVVDPGGEKPSQSSLLPLAEMGKHSSSPLLAGEGQGVRAAKTTNGPECLAVGRGSMLFAHFGLSGPVILDVSHFVSGHPQPSALLLRCDLLPSLAEDDLDVTLARRVAASGKRQVAGLLESRLPRRVCETLVALAEIPPDRPAAELSKLERRRLVQFVKHLDIPVAGTMGFRKAEVTAGGIALDEVESRTMQSRIVPNLYLAGELLDLNGPVGGYNFQVAFSTGWLAGENM